MASKAKKTRRDPEDSDQVLAGSCQHLYYVRMVAKTFCPRTTTTIETTETETKETIETKLIRTDSIESQELMSSSRYAHYKQITPS
jgi:hypothetical protein